VTIKQIVEAYLREHNYEGLCNPFNECGCALDDDFMSCDEPLCDCVPARRTIGDAESDLPGEVLMVPAAKSFAMMAKKGDAS